MGNKVVEPFVVITALDGTPLEDGYVYIAQDGFNPQTNPIPVYWDSDLTIPAAQPVRTIDGYFSRRGARS